MNTIHDLGGMDGLGAIDRETDEPVFHEDWERQVAGLFFTTILGGIYNDDEFRQSRERLEPARYLTYSYYHQWLLAIERLLVEKKILTRDEIEMRIRNLGRKGNP
ncbi:MAG: nitrile hydratase subunit beta [Acidiferrobacterales bacterium]|nr:nitrile hydratase subunit beta [Acidiferrobacterales bacterium]